MRNLKICILGLALASCSRSEEEQSDTTGFSEPAPNYELVYDDGLAGRLANAAATVSKKKVTEPYNPCWSRVWEAMRWTYGNQIENTTVGRPHAYNFAEWANPSAKRLFDTFKLKKTPFVGADIPVGSVVVWKRGSCGYSKKAGHIEIVVSPGTACSFYCGPICTSAVPEVYVPVKKQIRNEIINPSVATTDIPNQVWTPGMASTVPDLFTPGDRPMENRPAVVTSDLPKVTPAPQVVRPVPMPTPASDPQCKYGRDSAGFCNISPDLNPFALAH